MQLPNVSQTLLTRVALVALCLLVTRIVDAQQQYAVGQAVEVYCNCLGPTNWVPGTIEEDQGNGNYRVRYGTGWMSSG